MVAPRGPQGWRRRPRLVWALAGLVLCVLLVAVLVTVLRGGGTSSSTPPVGGPSGVRWDLQFSEDFDSGRSALLESGTWHAGWFGNGKLTGPVNSLETALLSVDNVSVADGRATLEVTPNVDGAVLADGTTQPNLGAALNTDESQASRGFMMTYGYVEARMQLPAGSPAEGVWPAFWLNGHTWPDDMEIDVVEGDGTDQGCDVNIHYGAGEDTANLNDDARHHTVPGATTGMHTYAADIRPDGVTFYYDGVAVHTYEGEVPDAPRYLMVGITSERTMSSPRSLVVDYVRAWTRG